ncbi:substrate-binding periplasmic protein [Motilimonas eburnea]|uniref:substrate-binding periplasmic protein n=1 Tax=Motilimonas eburnea TaxID=1737488 RepID=UPI001E5C1EA1|nr:transporter substrate-binding domain-containing protein [Motilimonas eburnea]MCE2572735.1 transporter substrate-binding domain-containing protein [Motilimonas eburnea]
MVCVLLLNIAFANANSSINADCHQSPLIWGWIDWPPFIYQQADGEFKGIDYQIISKVMAKISCEVTLSSYPIPWRRQLAWLEVGQIAMMNGASKTPEREKYAYFSIPYRSESVSLFIRKADLETRSISHLSQLLDSNIHSLGYSKGSYYGEEFAQLLNQAEFAKRLYSDFDINNFHRLSNARLDAVIADSISGAALIKQLELSDQIIAMPGMKIVTGDIHIMFSKKVVSLALIEQVNQAIKDYKTSAEYQQLMQTLTRSP